jgi:hypothetical protein
MLWRVIIGLEPFNVEMICCYEADPVMQWKISLFIKTRKIRNGYSERILLRTADISTCISTSILWRQGIYIFVTAPSRNAHTTRKITCGLRSSMSAGSSLEFNGEKSSMNMWLTTACEADFCRHFMSNLKVQNNQPRATTRPFSLYIH